MPAQAFSNRGSSQRELWRQVVRDLHRHMGWKALALNLGVSVCTLKSFANRYPLNFSEERGRYPNTGSIVFTYERALWLLQGHAWLYPEKGELRRTLKAEDRLPAPEAIARALDRR